MATRSMHADGSALYVEMSFGMIHDGGAVVGVVATIRDITERFQQERDERTRVKALEERIATLEASGATASDSPA